MMGGGSGLVGRLVDTPEEAAIAAADGANLIVLQVAMPGANPHWL